MNKQNTQQIIADYSKRSEAFWKKIQEKESLALFKKAATGSAAYQKFLKKHGLSRRNVQSYEDFSTLPVINKKNYFHQYSLREVVWKNYLENFSSVATSTSGSTGFPTYFLRTDEVDHQYSVLAEFFLQNQPKKKTLLINCFGMGVWIGGVITYQAFRYASLRGFPLTIITPGINKNEIFHCLRELAPQFDCVIMCGYPPFLKNVI